MRDPQVALKLSAMFVEKETVIGGKPMGRIINAKVNNPSRLKMIKMSNMIDLPSEISSDIL